MRLIRGLQRRRSLVTALAVAFVIVGGVAAWRASQTPAAAFSEDKQHSKELSKERLRRGVGSEVRFASAASRPEQLDESVRSAADFIRWRSGILMSDETRRNLSKAEGDVLKGKVKRITLGELTDDLTSAVVERLATATDEEIELAADASAGANGEIKSRADGRWGVLTRDEFIQQAQSGREWSQQGDSALGVALRPMIEEEVNGRASALAAALPEQFGQAGTQGITPTQALLIAYSVGTDDPLADSRGDIEQAFVQQRMEARQTREQKKAQTNVSGRPYGEHGAMHPSAAPLFLRTAVGKILGRAEGSKLSRPEGGRR
ncbi:MAG: hypothetical protein ACJ74T_03850 [Pyrinomonadaceae bacterium]